MLGTIDAAILIFVQNLQFDWVSKVMILYTKTGNNGLIWIVVSLILMCFKSTRRAGLLALLAMLLGLIINNYLLKDLIARPRPWLMVEGLLPLMEPPDPHSFPSGHTCAAFSAAGIWWRTLPRRWMRAAAIASAALMGFSRLYVGVHYTTDVLVGMCVGLLCAWVTFLAFEKCKAYYIKLK